MPDSSELLLPEGRPFERWEPTLRFDRTLHVAQHEGADDANDGSAAAPLRTLQAAAERVQPGEQVLVHAGIYREQVQPRRGGTGPDRMVSFAAAPNETVVVRGSELIDPHRWRPARHAPLGPLARFFPEPLDPNVRLWMTRLPRQWFVGDNPFLGINRSQFANEVIRRANPESPQHMFSAAQIKRSLLKRGLLFQDGRRLTQVSHTAFMDREPGTFWLDSDGRTLIVRPFDDADPASVAFEATARRQLFAPDADDYNLGYIHLAGITFEHAGDGWPLPPEGAVSTNGGHHWIIENCTIRQCNAVGIEAGAHPEHADFRDDQMHGYHVIRRNDISNCGCSGMAGTRMDGSLVAENHVHHCAWHTMEMNFENCGIKFHATRDCLFEGNVIHDIIEGCGMWLDARIENTRVTRNLVYDCQTLFGGIFLEVSRDRPNLVDHNVILNMLPNPTKGRGGHGVYEHDCDRITVTHNLIANCRGAAVMLKRGEAGRMMGASVKRGSTGRKHVVTGNLIIHCSQWIELHNADNTSADNLFVGAPGPAPLRVHQFEDHLDLDTWREFYGFDRRSAWVEGRASFDAQKREVRVVLDTAPLVLARSPHTVVDFTGESRGASTPAGPFERLDAGEQAFAVDPWQTRSSR